MRRFTNRMAGLEADRICVIKNPEIQALVPTLLDALADPSKKSQMCLQSLLDTEFVHVIDPPSLALIMPTLKCTLEIRSTDTKKMAAQIMEHVFSHRPERSLPLSSRCPPRFENMIPCRKLEALAPKPWGQWYEEWEMTGYRSFCRDSNPCWYRK